jgi:tryptophan 7-halogenase
MSGGPNKVVVVGRDAALWLAACVLQRALGASGVSVTAIELPSALGPASLYASLPPLEALHAKLGLDEAALLRAIGGSFSLGWNIVAPGERPFFLAHGSYGAPIDDSPFLPHWVKARRFGLLAEFEDFSLVAAAARQGRMLLPDQETATMARTDYAYHLPATAYVVALKSGAARLGVEVVQTRSISIETEGNRILSVRPEGGEEVAGDLFIDASGREALLFGPKGKVAERRLIARAAPFAAVPVYGEIRIGQHGWTALHGTPGATYVTHAYSTAQSDKEALADASRTAGLPLAHISATDVVIGRRPAPWQGNRVAIGAAAAGFDPLFDVELHAIQLGLVHLLSLFPVDEAPAAERAEYNRLVGSSFDRLAEFASAFRLLNRFAEQGYWAEARQAEPSVALAHKVAAFCARGTIAPMEDETFAPDLWAALFIGLGEMPESWPPAIDRTPPEQLKNAFRRTLGLIRDKVLAQPTHQAYLARLRNESAA